MKHKLDGTVRSMVVHEDMVRAPCKATQFWLLQDFMFFRIFAGNIGVCWLTPSTGYLKDTF